MSELYAKINAKERPVGWYHSGPKLRPSDLTINELFRRYCTTPILAIVDPVMHASSGSGNKPSPINAYVAVEEIGDDGSATGRTFAHLPSAIESEEAEEVGVEHLLRDIRDTPLGSLSQAINAKSKALGSFDRQLSELDAYLNAVVQGRLPLNHGIMASVQDMFNLLPDPEDPAVVAASQVTTNDQLASLHVGALARALIALNDLVANKLDAAAAAVN